MDKTNRNRWAIAAKSAGLGVVIVVLAGCAGIETTPLPTATMQKAAGQITEAPVTEEPEASMTPMASLAVTLTAQPDVQETSVAVLATDVKQTDRTPAPLPTPAVVLVVDGQEQRGGASQVCKLVDQLMGGPAYQCSQYTEGATAGRYFDVAVQVPPEPIAIEPDQEVVFRAAGDSDPAALTLHIYRVDALWVNPLENSVGADFFLFDHTAPSLAALNASREATFHAPMEPGQYIVILLSTWSQGDSEPLEMSYAFYIAIA